MGNLIATKDLTNPELVAAWNILQFSLRTIGDKSDLPPKIAEVKAELTARGIPFQDGRRIQTAN